MKRFVVSVVAVSLLVGLCSPAEAFWGFHRQRIVVRQPFVVQRFHAQRFVQPIYSQQFVQPIYQQQAIVYQQPIVQQAVVCPQPIVQSYSLPVVSGCQQFFSY